MKDMIVAMTSFYIKTDLAVAGPFTGIEVREATLAGIVRPGTLLSHGSEGPWVAAAGAGLFCDKGNALPHPAGSRVPTYQTRGMPGAFMGPFKLRELIGFACQGMLPPGTELQSDPSRPWIPITGTGILPACLRGDLVRIDEGGKLVLRTLVPKDLSERRERLKSLISPIERAKQIQAKGATAAPLADSANRVAVKSSTKSRSSSAPDVIANEAVAAGSGAAIDDGSGAAESSVKSSGESVGLDRRNEAFGFGAMRAPAQEKELARDVERRRRVGVFSRLRDSVHERIGQLVRPRVAVKLVVVMVVIACVIGLPVGYSAYKRMPLPQQSVVGNWVGVVNDVGAVEQAGTVEQAGIVNEAGATKPTFGVSLSETGTCVLVNATGTSWTGKYSWTDRQDERSGFRPDDELVIRYDEAEPHHRESTVEPSDGYLKLGGFVKSPPRLDGHPVRDLFVRCDGERLSLGYPVSARWVDGRRELTAAWVDANRNRFGAGETAGGDRSTREIVRHLESLPEELPRGEEIASAVLPIAKAIGEAKSGHEFELSGRKVRWNACFTFSYLVDVGYLLEQFGVPAQARAVREFEKPLSYGGPSLVGAVWLRYDGIDFMANPDGRIVFLAIGDPIR